MKIMVIGVDSDIGAAIAARHVAMGDEVHTTSRRGKGTHKLELVHPLQWPKLEQKVYDRLYYCIGVGDGRISRAEVIHINAFLTCDCLFKMRESVKDGGKIVVLSSGWSSISQLRSSKALVYRMSKAALNMGVAGMANRDRTVNWILMNPGMVDTKMTENLMMSQTLASEFISTAESAEGVVKSADAVTKQFAFVDYQGQEVPF